MKIYKIEIYDTRGHFDNILGDVKYFTTEENAKLWLSDTNYFSPEKNIGDVYTKLKHDWGNDECYMNDWNMALCKGYFDLVLEDAQVYIEKGKENKI